MLKCLHLLTATLHSYKYDLQSITQGIFKIDWLTTAMWSVMVSSMSVHGLIILPGTAAGSVKTEELVNFGSNVRCTNFGV